MPIIVAVCGSRDHHDAEHVYRTLDAIHTKYTISLLINGGQTGADRQAENWAVSRRVRSKREAADWRRYGDRAAGPIRNQKILDDYKPDMLCAFPGGSGTADMMRRARMLAYVEDCSEIAPRTYLIKMRTHEEATS